MVGRIDVTTLKDSIDVDKTVTTENMFYSN